MDTKFQTSFIPKRPVVAGGNMAAALSQPTNIISVICKIIFVLALLGAGGVFAYEYYLNNRIQAMGNELEIARASFDNKLFDQFMRLDAKLNSAEQLLGRHVAPSLLFEALQNMTVKNIQFREFDYKLPDLNGLVFVSMRGTATSFNAIALQSEVFAQNKFIKNASFSDITLDDKGSVVFNVQIQVDHELVAYKNHDSSLSFMYGMRDNSSIIH